MFLRSVFIYGTLQVLSNYYEAKFDNRKLSSMIGPVQVATSYTVGELYHKRKYLKYHWAEVYILYKIG